MIFTILNTYIVIKQKLNLIKIDRDNKIIINMYNICTYVAQEVSNSYNAFLKFQSIQCIG